MRGAGNGRAARMCALFACAAFGACSYDFDGLVAQTSAGGAAGTGGAAGQGGSSGGAGSNDGGGAAGTGGAGTGNAGSAGRTGTGGNAGTTVDAGKGGNAGTADAGKGGNAGTPDAGKGGSAGTADATSDRAPDAISDVRAEVAFDCAAVSGTVYQAHCYYPSPALTNWDTAKNTACAAPSHLAVITTVGEQMVVAAILPNTDRWIGLRKDLAPNMESSFHWVTTEALSYKIWDSYETGAPEPNYTGDCVRLRATNHWGDTACTETYAAICERE